MVCMSWSQENWSNESWSCIAVSALQFQAFGFQGPHNYWHTWHVLHDRKGKMFVRKPSHLRYSSTTTKMELESPVNGAHRHSKARQKQWKASGKPNSPAILDPLEIPPTTTKNRSIRATVHGISQFHCITSSEFTWACLTPLEAFLSFFFIDSLSRRVPLSHGLVMIL